MLSFLLSLFFFLLALGLFWGVLHWVRYKKRTDACSCGTGACLAASSRQKKVKAPAPPDHPCGTSSCGCEE
ncbi:MAG: hypothetical protein GXY54_09770 [Deltaproteobacteria bacterium]|nr:hypothetical protein [Deltaproteobacteria bacterium]